MEFNASVYVTEQLNRQMVNMSQDLAYRAIKYCGEKYNFDAEEACRELGLALVKVERKSMTKEKSEKKEKKSEAKPRFPLPYNGELNENCCYGLRQNSGLFTQCTGVRKTNSEFCKGCASQMQKTGAEMPEYGTIKMRKEVGIFEYVDPKGRKPIAYTKIMKKYKITEKEVLEEASKFNITVDPQHFVVVQESKRGRPKIEREPKEKGAKGRPKKEKKVLQIEGDDDIFAALVAEANVEPEIGMNKKTDEEKEAEKAEKEAEKAEKEAKRQAEKEAKRQAEKAEKEAKIAAEKAEKEKAKLEKKEADRLAKEAKKKAEEEEKAAKKAAAELAKKEKEAKIAAEKEAKKALAEQKKKSSTKSKDEPKDEPKDEEEEDEPEVVKAIKFEDKKYLKSKKSGIIYDYDKYINDNEQVVVGKWSESLNKIIFDDAEETEDEYDL